MMTRRSNRERAPSRKVMESQTPTRVQPSINASDKPVLKDFGKKDDAVVKLPSQSPQHKAHNSKPSPKPQAQKPQPKVPSPKPNPKPSPEPSPKPSPVAQVQQKLQVMESQKPIQDDAVAKVPAKGSQPKAHCQKLTAKSPTQSPQFKAHSPKPGPKPSSVAQVQQKSRVQQETNDQSVHFSGVNTTNECNEFPTTHYALTL